MISAINSLHQGGRKLFLRVPFTLIPPLCPIVANYGLTTVMEGKGTYMLECDSFKNNWFRTFIRFYEGHIIVVCLIPLRRLIRMKIFIRAFINCDVIGFFSLLSSYAEDSKGLENYTIFSSELFDFDVILIFNSFNEGHDSFSWPYDAFPFHMMNMVCPLRRQSKALEKKQDSCAEYVMSRFLVAPEVGAVSITSPTRVLDLVDYLSFDCDLSEDSLPPAPDLPLVSPFLCFDDSEGDSESEPAEQRPKIRQKLVILIQPKEAILFCQPYRTHLNGPFKLLTERKRVCVTPPNGPGWNKCSGGDVNEYITQAQVNDHYMDV
nr:hypothetical protein [Tanacetum cinerariifolium]